METAVKNQYHVVTRPISSANLQKMAMEEVLNISANEGFEFVTMIVENHSNQIIYFFKRS